MKIFVMKMIVQHSMNFLSSYTETFHKILQTKYYTKLKLFPPLWAKKEQEGVRNCEQKNSRKCRKYKSEKQKGRLCFHTYHKRCIIFE